MLGIHIHILRHDAAYVSHLMALAESRAINSCLISRRSNSAKTFTQSLLLGLGGLRLFKTN